MAAAAHNAGGAWTWAGAGEGGGVVGSAGVGNALHMDHTSAAASAEEGGRSIPD